MKEDRNRTEEEIRIANVIIIVYSVEDIRSFHRLGTHWLPLIRTFGTNVPVVLVGNKIDVRGVDITNENLEDEILPLMSDFKEIETCVECSAKGLVNVAEAFYFAQKAVLHPTAPLYDSREHCLKEASKRALERMFRLSDKDCDGLLSDEELNGFQVRCFKTALQHEELEGIKDILRETDGDYVVPGGITMDGFIYLHKLFIQRGRLETSWTAIRAFGYDDSLNLKQEVLQPNLRVPEGSSVIISPKGYKFLTDLFTSHDKDHDGTLSWSQLEELFLTTPENPWLALGFPETTLTDEHGSVTLEGFLAQWAMTTLLNYKVTLEYIAWLGYEDGSTTEALKVISNGKRLTRYRERQQRDTFLCWLFGAPGSGKSAICRNFIRRPFTPSYMPTLTPNHVVNSVPCGGTEKYLVLEEISTHASLDKEILADQSLVDMVDAVCYVYDQSDPNSFNYIVSVREAHPQLKQFPSIVLMTKSDKPAVIQKSTHNPVDYCKSEGLIGPIAVSAKEENLESVYSEIVQVAVKPPNVQKGSSPWITAGLVATLLAVGATTAYVAYHYHSKKHSNP